MRLVLGLFILIHFAAGCSKNDEATTSNGFAGSYRGTVIDTINGAYWATLNDYAIIINPTNSPGQVTLSNNLLLTNSGTITGNTFIIPETVATQTSSLKVIEKAIGTFTGPNNNTWSVTFYQDQVDPASNATIATMSRTCLLIKQ